MSDLLAEIKARQDQWSTVTPVCIHEDVGWLISEVERLTEDMNIAHQEISRRNDAGMEQAAVKCDEAAEQHERKSVYDDRESQVIKSYYIEEDRRIAAAIRKEIKT